jgi:hypothetical protein
MPMEGVRIHRDWTPQLSFQVSDGPTERRRIVPKVTKPTVAVEAEYPANPAGLVVVVDVVRTFSATYRTPVQVDPTTRVGLLGGDPIAALEVIIAATTVMPLARLIDASVPAWLAVAAEAIAFGPIAHEFGEWLHLVTVRAVLHPGWDLTAGTCGITHHSRTLGTPILRFRIPFLKAGLAIVSSPVGR